VVPDGWSTHGRRDSEVLYLTFMAALRTIDVVSKALKWGLLSSVRTYIELQCPLQHDI